MNDKPLDATEIDSLHEANELLFGWGEIAFGHYSASYEWVDDLHGRQNKPGFQGNLFSGLVSGLSNRAA
jgi:hypothetical protein